MSGLTHDDQRASDQNPNANKGNKNKEKSVDMLNTMKNRVVRGEIVVSEM